jgi:hypothetical protein
LRAYFTLFATLARVAFFATLARVAFLPFLAGLAPITFFTGDASNALLPAITLLTKLAFFAFLTTISFDWSTRFNHGQALKDRCE